MNANLAGFAAILMWSLLALLTSLSGSVPPFQLLAMSFAIGTLIGLPLLIKRVYFDKTIRLRLISPGAILLGITGLFFYHFFYYTALRHAPVAEASLIAYLWPLLIVLFSSFLPGEKLRWFHFIGALIGFFGAALIIIGTPTSDGVFNPAIRGAWTGYGSALLCALIWSSYSVFSRLFSKIPSEMVALYCLATTILSILCHLVFEQTVWPENTGQWLAILGLGLMPVGLAFYVWDYAVKHGNIQLIGSASYLAPVLSIFILIFAGQAQMTDMLILAALMVSLGAFIASGRFLKTASKH